MIDRLEFKCNHCNKLYSSYKSRWLHIKKYHNKNISQKSSKNKENSSNSPQKTSNFECNYCNKILSRSDNLKRHEEKCKLKNINNNENDKFEKLEKQNEKLEKQVEELKDMLQKALKIHPKTLQKINNQLNNNHINNGTVNNINIVQLGNENLEDILSSKEKLKILNKRGNSLKELVELVHISDKYKQFKNVYITNLQNTIGYKFDSKNNQFIAVNKSDLLDDIIDCRMCDIQTFYTELGDNFDGETKKIIQRFLDRMNNEDDKLKGLKKEEIKLLLYNSREKIQATTQLEI